MARSSLVCSIWQRYDFIPNIRCYQPEKSADPKYYSQYHNHELFEIQESLSGLSKSNRWVKLADNLPWDKIEQEYNKRLKNRHNGAGNKPARMVVGALIVKHARGAER